MSRVRVMSASAFDLAEFEQTGFVDPVVRVLGELPGTTQPFGINRVYKGAQGTYEEVLVLADPDGVVLWESSPRRIELRGEMFEDLFRLTVRQRIPIGSTREHALGFLLDGEVVGRIPVFIDAPDSATAAGVVLDAAETALKKGSICWLSIPQRDGSTLQRPAWYVQQGQRLFFVKGGAEQELPGLEDAHEVTLHVKSKDVKAAIGDLRATVRVVTDEDEIDRITGLGLGNRLNLPDGEGALARWKATCTVVELTPQAS